MGENSKIEWCDHTFNLVWGCTRVSQGCTQCYAEALAKRYGHAVWGPKAPRRTMSNSYWQQPFKWNAQAAGRDVRARVFCSSMADVFEDHPTNNAERPKLWETIFGTEWLDWLLLTKRPENIASMLPDNWGDGYPNVWLGTSVEDQDAANKRIPLLLQIPAAVRFLSVEPMLGPVDLINVSDGPRIFDCLNGLEIGPMYQHTDQPRISWVIFGGESGPGARPMNPRWVSEGLAQCKVARVPAFVKQMGSVIARRVGWKDSKGGDWSEWPREMRVREFPKVQVPA